MSLDAKQKAALKKLARGHSTAELKALFALVRGSTDRTLLAALKTPAKAAKKKADPLLRDVELALRPIMGPAAEKADLLVDHLAQAHGVDLDFTARGLADALRRLRAHFSDAQIRAGAKSLMAELAARHSRRETVV